jgi:hypothetical protein
MMKISLYDKEFEHIKNPTSYCGYDSPANIEWNRDGNDEIAAFTERCFDYEIINKCTSKTKICWPLESPFIHPLAYEWTRDNWQIFDYVMTFDEELMRRIPKSKTIFWSPGGSWIWRKDWAIYPKNKNVSIVAGMKRMTEGHKLRHEVIARIGDRFDMVCGYGRNPVEPKMDIFKDYRFTVVIENCKRNWYWTDKLVDPMLCGTVPIFWGCPAIGDYFDARGILTFDTTEELAKILSTLDVEHYESLRPYIEENFRRAQKFAIVEDYMYNSFFKQFDKASDDIRSGL